jgi:glycerol-3-phosphate dehydrogenase (NAD(P)+)
MSKTISIIGDGAMGTVCAILLAENGHRVRLWSAFPEAAREMAQFRENRRFLPGTPLCDSIEVTADDNEALRDCTLVISAVPTQFMRSVWGRLKPHCDKGLPICSVAKGIENRTLLRPTQILRDVLDGPEATRSIAALSGPSIAPEIARKLPATVAVASADAALAASVQWLLNRPYFRIYTNEDLLGVEIAGATKNVIAIAAGILDGLRAGDNAKAALLTRGLVEIGRLGRALGAKAETFAGLAGMGDLVTTCFSPIGRNRSFGEAVGRGQTIEQALASVHGVVEGVPTTQSVVELAKARHVQMPLTQGVYDVVFNARRPSDAIEELMSRPLKAESV